MATTMMLRLNAPGMTALHKAGLAGLYMTLQAFDEKEQTIDGLQWQLDSQQVLLRWTDKTPKPAFEKLIKKSFWIDEQGFFRLAGLPIDDADIEKKYHLYEALNNSFFTHRPHCPKGSGAPLPYKVGDADSERFCLIKNFAPVIRVKPYEDASKRFIDKRGNFVERVEAKGWLYPGAVKRHEVFNETTLRETIETALALMYAPVGVFFYRLKTRVRSATKKRKSLLALIVPEILNLEVYAMARQYIARQGVLELTASSASDAVFRMLLSLRANEKLEEIRTTAKFDARDNQDAKKLSGSDTRSYLRDAFTCRVITFGNVSWDNQHKVRTQTRTVFSCKVSGLEDYELAAALFQNRWLQGGTIKVFDSQGNATEKEGFFLTTFCARGMIADNIANGKVWYDDVATYMMYEETRKQLIREREGLAKMVAQTTLDESKRLFIEVFHSSWERRLGKLGQRARDERMGDDGYKRLVRNEAEKLRTSLARCKNAQTLRGTVVDFWSRAGANELLQGSGLNRVLSLFDETSWREAKDLALLALVSYQPRDKRVIAALQETDSNSTPEGDEEQ